MNEHWTTDAPEAGRIYWMTKRYADGSFHHAVQRKAQSEYDIDGEDSPRGNWKWLVRDYWLRSTEPIVPPPLPASSVEAKGL